ENGAGIEKYVEGGVPKDIQVSGKLAVKTVEAFGTKFSGQAVFKGGKMRSVYLTPENSKMSPEVALKAFNDLGKSLSEKLGEPYHINNVPNFEDGSEPRKDYRLWMVGKDVVVLNLTAYSKRAGVYLQRMNRVKWQADMGADTGQYWEAKLKELGVPQ